MDMILRTGWDRLAPRYRALETLSFGAALQRARCAWIKRLAGRQNILLLGEGNGRFLAEALEVAPEARFTVVDGSEGMIAVAKCRIAGNLNRVDFIHARIPDGIAMIGARGPFDAIAAHFFFDCFTTDEVTEVVEVVAGRAAPNATWLVSDFHVSDSPWWKRFSSKLVVGALYRAFRIMTGLRTLRLPSWEPAMRANSFHRSFDKSLSFGLIRSDVWTRTGSDPTFSSSVRGESNGRSRRSQLPGRRAGHGRRA